MKLTKKELKEVVHIAENSCNGIACANCFFHNYEKNSCSIMSNTLLHIEQTDIALSDIKNNAKNLIRNLL